MIKCMSGSECTVRREIGAAVRSVPRTPGTVARIDASEFDAWLHEAPLPVDKPKEYDLFGAGGKPRNLSGFLSKLKERGSGSKKLSAAFYYRLHMDRGYAQFAEQVDRLAFDGLTFKEKFKHAVFEFEDVEEPSLLARTKTAHTVEFNPTSAANGLITTDDGAFRSFLKIKHDLSFSLPHLRMKDMQYEVLRLQDYGRSLSEANRFAEAIYSVLREASTVEKGLALINAGFHDLLNIFIDRMHDRLAVSFVRLVLEATHFLKVAGRPQEADQILSLLPDFKTVSPGLQISNCIVERMDLLLRSSMIHKSSVLSHVDEHMKAMSSEQQASVLRCFACIALRSGSLEEALEHSGKARALLPDVMPSYSPRTYLHIPLYLDAIDALASYRLGLSSLDTALGKLRACIDFLTRKAPDDISLLLAFYAGMRELVATGDPKSAFIRDAVRTSKNLQLTLTRFVSNAPKDFCFFDISEATEALNSQSLP